MLTQKRLVVEQKAMKTREAKKAAIATASLAEQETKLHAAHQLTILQGAAFVALAIYFCTRIRRSMAHESMSTNECVAAYTFINNHINVLHAELNVLLKEYATG